MAGNRVFGVGRTFDDYTSTINSMDFNKTGTLLVTSANDDTLRVYDCMDGMEKTKIPSKKYGVDQVRFTQTDNVICGSNNSHDFTLRLLCPQENKYLRYFSGHRAKVQSLEMSPLDESFLSSSEDGTIRLWDIRSQAAQGLMRTQSDHSSVAYDPSGLVFVVGIRNTIAFYDRRNFQTGPFTTATIQQANPECHWNSIRFRNDGEHILLSLSNGDVFVINGYTGEPIHRFQGCKYQATYSPDSQSILFGSQKDPSIQIIDAKTGSINSIWQSDQLVDHVIWNPHYMMIAAASSHLSMWIPVV